MSHTTVSVSPRRLLGAVALVVAALVAANPASAATPSGYQIDQLRLAGPGRLVVNVAAPQQVPGLPASPRGYHVYCSTTVSPILRYRIKYSAPGDSYGFGLRAQWARPGSTSFVPFGLSNPYGVEGSSYGAPKTLDHPISGSEFLSGPSGQAIPVAPPVALLDLRLIARTGYWIPLFGDLGYSVDVDQATLTTKLDFRVGQSTTCPEGTPPYPRYFKAR